MGPQMALAYCKEYGPVFSDWRTAGNLLSCGVLDSAMRAAATEQDREAVRLTEKRAREILANRARALLTA